jgi:lipoate-protein ligase A
VRLLAAVSGIWRLIQDGAGHAAWNMAVDEAILEAIIAGEQPPTVRFYRWAKPSVSLGRLQRAEKVLNMSLCRERGIPVVQRLTGGKAVLHGHDLTLCVVAPLRSFAPARRVLEVHLRLVTALARGFRMLGVDTRPVVQTGTAPLQGVLTPAALLMRCPGT